MTTKRVDERLTYDDNGNYFDKRVSLKGSSDGYSEGVGAWRKVDVNPEWTHYAGETVVDVTGQAIGTYNYYLDMATFRQLGLQLVIGGAGTTTVTVEATMQDDGTAPGSITDYHDVTSALFGAASFTASDFLVDNAKVLASAKWVKIKVVVTADVVNYTIYSRRSW